MSNCTLFLPIKQLAPAVSDIAATELSSAAPAPLTTLPDDMDEAAAWGMEAWAKTTIESRWEEF